MYQKKLKIFQSTLSVRRATVSTHKWLYQTSYFNPRSPWGERHGLLLRIGSNFLFQSTLSVRRATCYNQKKKAFPSRFQSTLSVRRATVIKKKGLYPVGYFNPRSPWGERQVDFSRTFILLDISIHALREESDNTYCRQFNRCLISIHALREESDRQLIKALAYGKTFQSTLSVRRAT